MKTLEIEIPTEEEYDRLADEYQETLTWKDYMEVSNLSVQRLITGFAFDLIATDRPRYQLYSEVIVQYPRPSDGENRQVVPDSMLILEEKGYVSRRSFNVAREAAKLFMVVEYVSRGVRGRKKDYEVNRLRYERELGVPYYMLYDPEKKTLKVLELVGGEYADIRANELGRFPIEELDLEVALVRGWVRFWYEGKLLPRPAEMQAELKSEKIASRRERTRANRLEKRADDEAKRADDEAKRSEALAAKLRALGIDPEA